MKQQTRIQKIASYAVLTGIVCLMLPMILLTASVVGISYAGDYITHI